MTGKDSFQTLWLVRGALFVLAGLCALVGSFFVADWPYTLLVAATGLGLGTWNIWMAVSSMADDRQRRLTAPARIESAERGLESAGWIPPSGDTGKDARRPDLGS